MTGRPQPFLAPVPGGWSVHRAGRTWVIRSQTPGGAELRVDQRQLTELTIALLAGTWPEFVEWSPHRTWAVVRSTSSGGSLWCGAEQMAIVADQIISHVHQALTRADTPAVPHRFPLHRRLRRPHQRRFRLLQYTECADRGGHDADPPSDSGCPVP